MKIGYLFSRYPVPSQTFCDTEMRAIEQRGFQVEIYSCSPPVTSFRHEAEGRPAGPVFHAPPPAGLELGRLGALARGAWPAALIAAHEARFGADRKPSRRALHAVAFAERLRRRGVEHLHVHFANRATHAALFIHALTGIPFSFTAHAQDFLVDLGNDALLREMCAQAAFVVAVSDFSRRALVEKCPDAAFKIHRIYNGLPLDRWPSPPPRACLASRTLHIFSAGRLIEFKGFDDLIAACALLRESAVDFHCEIAGEGPALEALERQIAALRLSSQVHLRGLLPQGEIRARLANCDVFALASREDAKGACDVLPTVILEAMAAGRPVISTRLAGIPEMVADRQTGLLVEPGEIEALAAALATLAADQPLRERLGDAGRACLEDRFSSGITSGQLAALFASSREVTQQPQQEQIPLVLLIDSWPSSETDEAFRLEALPDAVPGMRILALRAGKPPAKPLSEEQLSVFCSLEFLPDAIVLEAEWRECAAVAHLLESWRGRLGTGVETEDYLLAARRALYLHRRWQSEPEVRHIHAIGPESLLCAWLLMRLHSGRQASFLLPVSAPGALSNSVLRRLAPDFIAGWLPAAPGLAAELGEAFHGDGVCAKADTGKLWKTFLARQAASSTSL